MTAGTHIIDRGGTSTTVVEIPSEVFFTGMLVALAAGGVAVLTFLALTFVRTWRPATRERHEAAWWPRRCSPPSSAAFFAPCTCRRTRPTA